MHGSVLYRNVVLLLFIPILLIYLINSIVGTTPKNLRVGYVIEGEGPKSCDSFYERMPGKNESAVRHCLADDPLQYICSYLKILGDFDYDIRLVGLDY